MYWGAWMAQMAGCVFGSGHALQIQGSSFTSGSQFKGKSAAPCPSHRHCALSLKWINKILKKKFYYNLSYFSLDMLLVVDWLWFQRLAGSGFLLLWSFLANWIKPFYVTHLKAHQCQCNIGGQLVNTSTSQCVVQKHPQTWTYRKSDIYERKLLSLKFEKWR